jgi:hypothetical protein
LRRWNERRAHAPLAGGPLRSVLLVLVFVAGVASRAAAQQEPQAQGTLIERLNLDKLRLSAIGVSGGAVKPTQMEGTSAYALHADYGEIAPAWRVVFSATYWGSRLTDETMQRFADSLRKSVVDPTQDFEIDLGRVSVSDVALDMDLRWQPRRFASTALRPYASGGVGAHVLNAEGKAIAGTFVERALDNITTGIAVSTGVDLVLFNKLSVGMQARFDLLSGARFGSLRAVGSYLVRPNRTPARR